MLNPRCLCLGLPCVAFVVRSICVWIIGANDTNFNATPAARSRTHSKPAFQDRLLEGRMFFSCSKGYPIMVSSVIHYKPQEEQAKRARQKRIDERGAEAFEIPKRCEMIIFFATGCLA